MNRVDVDDRFDEMGMSMSEEMWDQIWDLFGGVGPVVQGVLSREFVR